MTRRGGSTLAARRPRPTSSPGRSARRRSIRSRSGLVLAPLVARAWVAARAPADAAAPARRARGALLEGDDVWVTLERDAASARAAARSLVVAERIARLGERRDAAAPRRPRLPRHVRARAVPRGRYVVEAARGRRSRIRSGSRAPRSPLAARAARCSSTRGSSTLDRLFSESGAHAQDGRRLLLRRPDRLRPPQRARVRAGRVAAEGALAARPRGAGQLMVKELEDAPRDEIAVAARRGRGRAGAPPDRASTCRCARPARSCARTRRAAGAPCSRQPAARPSARVSSLEGDWLAALELLAAVEPDGARAGRELLAREAAPAARALELVVVTAAVSAALATGSSSARSPARRQRRLGRRAELRRPPDAASSRSCCGSRPPASPVAVVRRGDDLAAVARRRPGARCAAWLGRSRLYALPGRRSSRSRWLRLEDPRPSAATRSGSSLLALAPALAADAACCRLALAVPARARTRLWVAFDVPRRAAVRRTQDFFGPLCRPLRRRLPRASTTSRVPFSAATQPQMHGVVLLAVFGFCLVLALAHRRAAAAARACSRCSRRGWPATLYPTRRASRCGAFILAAGALASSPGCGRARLAAGARRGRGASWSRPRGASTSAAVAKDGVLAWEQLGPVRPAGEAGRRRLRLGRELRRDRVPEKRRRSSCDHAAPDAGLYWRATTLDSSTRDRWSRT